MSVRSEFSLKESSGLLSIVQLSKFFVLSFATALIDYHIFRRLSTTFLFLLFQRCVLARNSLSRISCSSTFVNNFFSFHIFRIFGCVSWTAVLLSPVSRDSLYNIAQQSHHCQQLFHLFSFFKNVNIKFDIFSCFYRFAVLHNTQPVLLYIFTFRQRNSKAATAASLSRSLFPFLCKLLYLFLE